MKGTEGRENKGEIGLSPYFHILSIFKGSRKNCQGFHDRFNVKLWKTSLTRAWNFYYTSESLSFVFLFINVPLSTRSRLVHIRQATSLGRREKKEEKRKEKVGERYSLNVLLLLLVQDSFISSYEFRTKRRRKEKKGREWRESLSFIILFSKRSLFLSVPVLNSFISGYEFRTKSKKEREERQRERKRIRELPLLDIPSR